MRGHGPRRPRRSWVEIIELVERLAPEPPRLWNGGRGFYFSGDDVLHVGMIGWMVSLVARVGPLLRDAEQSTVSP